MSQKHSILAYLLLMAAPLSARAEDVKRECVDASTLGQTSRDAGELLKAREQFLVCSRDACPAVVRTSCSHWLAEVQELTPSVVIRAADAADSDITDGVATIDGVQYPLDGKTIPLDPGKHVVMVESHDGVRAEKKVLLAAGEKSRLIELRMDTGKPQETSKPAVIASQPQPAAAPRADRKSSIPAGAWVLGGVSVVALGGFGYFAVSASSELDKLKKACSPSCTDKQTQTGRTNALLADVSLGVGVAALAGAVTWALLARSSSRESSTAARLAIAPTERGGYASFSTSF
jgi:hypothetical protein